MTRIYVTEPGIDDDYEPCAAGYFTEESATYWHGDKDVFDGSNLADVNTRDQNRGQGLYRTAQGRWVLRTWSNWGSEVDSHTYLTDDKARDWLIFNSYDEVVHKHFGAIEDERGPGRPEIGKPVPVRLGDVADAVNAYAAERGISRAEAIRRLVASGLAR